MSPSDRRQTPSPLILPRENSADGDDCQPTALLAFCSRETQMGGKIRKFSSTYPVVRVDNRADKPFRLLADRLLVLDLIEI